MSSETLIFAALATIVALGVAIVLPIASFVRTLQITRKLDALADRVRALERELSSAHPVERTRSFSVPGDGVQGAEEEESTSDQPAEPASGPDARLGPLAADADVDIPRHVASTAEEPSAVPPEHGESLEARIGMRWMLYVGTATLVLGLAFFVKYAFDNAWITETLRVVLGVVAGAGLAIVGRWFVRRGFSLYGQVLAGGGFAVIYLSIYAAVNAYGLLSPGGAFVLLVFVSLATGWEADRQGSPGLALAATVGGFAAPFVVGGAPARPAALFAYEAVLVALAVALSRRHGWPELVAVAYGFTATTVYAWIGGASDPAGYLVTELFLTLFCALFLLARRFLSGGDGRSSFVSSLLLSAPVLYHAASVFLLAPHSMALLVYLIAASLAGIVIASRSSHSAALRLLLYMAVGWPFFVWLETHEASPWIVPGAATLAAIYTMHLMAQIEESRRTQAPFSRADIVLFHLNGLGLFAAAYLLVDRVAPGRGHALALSLAALNALLARSLAKSPTRAAMHALALAFTMVALAIGLAFDGVWVAIGWAAEGAAVAWLGLSSARRWMRLGGVALLMVGVTVLLTGEFLQTLSGFVPVFNKRALTTAIVVGLLYAVAWFEARSREPRPPPFELGILMGVASFVTVAWLTAEVSSYWREHGGTAGSRFAADLSLSIVWALYAIALVVAGIRRRYAPVRYFAIVLFSLTLLKLFLSDLSQLAGIYRIAGFVAVGLILLAASLLYQKFRARLASG